MQSCLQVAAVSLHLPTGHKLLLLATGGVQARCQGCKWPGGLRAEAGLAHGERRRRRWAWAAVATRAARIVLPLRP